MSNIVDAFKRILVGRPVRSSAEHKQLPKSIALPIFASDVLSSIAYAPDEIILTLALAGVTLLAISPWVALAVTAVLLVVVITYRQTVLNYSTGGGYEVAKQKLGPSAGLGVASALMVDYALTVAVSVSAAAAYFCTAFPNLGTHKVGIAIVFIFIVALTNLRGHRQSGKILAIPVYAFLSLIFFMILLGMTKYFGGNLPKAPTSELVVMPVGVYGTAMFGIGSAFLVLRAFSSGCVALTGVEAIANRISSFRTPKPKNAAVTLVVLGVISAVILFGVVFLAVQMGVVYVEDPAAQLINADRSRLSSGFVQIPVLGQIAEVLFADWWVLVVIISIVTAMMLLIAANTAFTGFPTLTSTISRDSFIPHQFSTRGDRIVYSNGVLILSAIAAVFVVMFNGDVTRIIALYVIGVFVSFTISQVAMVKHFTESLMIEGSSVKRKEMQRSRALSMFGAVLTGTIICVVVLTKFPNGAWLSVALMVLLFVCMRLVRRHYDRVWKELEIDDLDTAKVLPSRVHGMILVTSINLPTLRAIAFARATRPSSLEAVTVEKNSEETAKLIKKWEKANMVIPITILGSPYREVLRPIGEHVQMFRRSRPHDLVVVFLPEYVVSRWWEKLLHNHTAARIKRYLLHIPNVVVADVPYQMRGFGTELSTNVYAQDTDKLVRQELLKNAKQVEHSWYNETSQGEVSFDS